MKALNHQMTPEFDSMMPNGPETETKINTMYEVEEVDQMEELKAG